MRTFKVQCRIRGQEGTFQAHVGRPAPGFHPLKFQAAWLREVHLGEIASELMEALAALQDKAREQGVALEEVLSKD